MAKEKENKKAANGKPAEPKSPMDLFFKLGDIVTKGDPKKKADFDYIMMWILFLAFFFVFAGNIYHFFTSGYKVAYLGWALFGCAIMYFQYYNLGNMRKMREYQKKLSVVDETKINDIEDVDEMMQGFENEK